MATVATLVARLIADRGNFNQVVDGAERSVRQLENRTQSASSTMTAAFDRIGRTGKIMSATVTAPIVALGYKLLQSASNAEETQSKFNAVFKSMADETRVWANETADSMGRSRISLEGYLANIQDTLVPLGFAREAAAGMSKQVVTLAEDLASFNNLPTADVLASIQSGLVGNVENFRRFGVVANEASINQELLNMGIIGGTKAASEQEKAQARLNILLKGTADAQGDAMRTAGSFANQMKALQAQLGDVSVELGQILIPRVLRLMDVIKSGIAWFKDLDSETKTWVVGIAAAAAAVGPLLVVLGMLPKALGAVRTGFLMMTGPVGWFIGAAALLYQAYRTNFLGMTDIVDRGISKIVGWFQEGVAAVESVREKWVYLFGQIGEATKRFIDFFGEIFVSGIDDTQHFAEAGIHNVNAIKNPIKSMVDWLDLNFQRAALIFIGASLNLESLHGAYRAFSEGVIMTLEGFGELLYLVFIEPWVAIYNGVREWMQKLGSLFSGFDDWAQEYIGGPIRRAFNIPEEGLANLPDELRAGGGGAGGGRDATIETQAWIGLTAAATNATEKIAQGALNVRGAINEMRSTISITKVQIENELNTLAANWTSKFDGPISVTEALATGVTSLSDATLDLGDLLGGSGGLAGRLKATDDAMKKFEKDMGDAARTAQLMGDESGLAGVQLGIIDSAIREQPNQYLLDRRGQCRSIRSHSPRGFGSYSRVQSD